MADTKEILRQRLRQRLTEKSISPHALSKAIGANPGYVRDLLDPAKSSIPSAERLGLMAGKLDITADWLLGKVEDPAQPVSEISFREAPAPWPAEGGEGIPLLGSGYCDELAVETEDGELQVERLLLETDHVVRFVSRPPALWAARDAYAIYFQGSSMEPRFHQGDVAVVDPRRPPRPGDDVVVQLTAGNGEQDVVTVLVKMLARVTASHYEFHQYKPERTFRIPRAHVARLHRIVPMAELIGA